MRMRIALAALAILVLPTGCSVWGSSTPQKQFDGTPIPGDAPAQDFTLHDQSGKTISLSDQRGRFVFVAFLYTQCTDICPLIAKQLDSAIRSLGPERSSVRVLAVSVDPVGDTPAQVRRYVRRLKLGPEFHYLVGTRAELAPIWQGYNVATEGRPSGKIVHGAPVFLVDRKGRPRLFYTPLQAPGAFAHDVRALMEQEPA